jgi:hypothetical protein
MTPQEMLDQLLAPGSEDLGVLANDFLRELGKTVPLESLRLLLTSEHERSRAIGAFLATFKGDKINNMLGELVALLKDTNPHTRSDAVEAIGRAASRDDGEALGHVLLCLKDEAHGVRWRTIEFARYCPSWQLRSACKHAPLLDPEFPNFAEVIAGWPRNVTPLLMEGLLHSADPIAARFALGLAGRPYSVVVDRFVELASQNLYPEVRDHAAQWLSDKEPLRDSLWHSALPYSKRLLPDKADVASFRSEHLLLFYNCIRETIEYLHHPRSFHARTGMDKSYAEGMMRLMRNEMRKRRQADDPLML